MEGWKRLGAHRAREACALPSCSAVESLQSSRDALSRLTSHTTAPKDFFMRESHPSHDERMIGGETLATIT